MSIYIACHKKTYIPSLSLYHPIALGNASIEGINTSDNTGDNISLLNPYYCELTATYWLWKNCHDDFIGLCHYRRYFNFIQLNNSNPLIDCNLTTETRDIINNPLQNEIIHSLLDRFDIIVPRTMFVPFNLSYSYNTAHRQREWDSMMKSINILYGNNRHGLDIDNRIHIGNMIICKRDIFKMYASQLFFVIDRAFNEIGISEPIEGARYQPYRYPGYLAERFTTAFINANKLSYYEAQVLNIIDL